MVVLVLGRVTTFEFGVACEVFATERPELDVPWWYTCEVCTDEPGELPALGGFGVRVDLGLEALREADTVIVPAPTHVDAEVPPVVLDALRDAAARGARMVSICSGAFVLAAAGLLDGRRVSTHWLYAVRLAQRYPALDVDNRMQLQRSSHGSAQASTSFPVDGGRAVRRA